MNSMKKIASAIRSNYGYIALALTVGVFLIIFQSLFLKNSDDRIYSIVGCSGLENVVYFMRYHYNFCNGRTMMHLLLMGLIRFGVYPWRIIMPLVAGCNVWLMGKFICADKQSFQKCLAFSALFTLSLSAGIYEDTLFWETGSFNYIVPALFILCLFNLMKSNKLPWLWPVLGFLCGATVEQFGMIAMAAVLMWILHRRFAQKEKITLPLVLTFVFSLLGILTLVFSPSVSARTYEDSARFIDKLSLLMFNYWFHSTTMASFLLIFSIVVGCYLISVSQKKLHRFVACVACLGLIASFVIQFLSIPYISVLAQYGFVALFLVCVLFTAVCALRRKNWLPLCTLLLGGGAQFMMLFTQRISVRTTMASLFCFMLFALSLLMSKEFSFLRAWLRTALVIVFVCIAALNILGYAQYAQGEAEQFREGLMVEKYADQKQTRDDVERVIEEFESVRLEQIEIHKQNKNN